MGMSPYPGLQLKISAHEYMCLTQLIMTIIVVQQGVNYLQLSAVLNVSAIQMLQKSNLSIGHRGGRRGRKGWGGAGHRLMTPQDLIEHNTSWLHAMTDDCMALHTVQCRIVHSGHYCACIAVSSGHDFVSCTHLVIFIYLVQEGFCWNRLALFKV